MALAGTGAASLLNTVVLLGAAWLPVRLRERWQDGLG